MVLKIYIGSLKLYIESYFNDGVFPSFSKMVFITEFQCGIIQHVELTYVKNVEEYILDNMYSSRRIYEPFIN